MLLATKYIAKLPKKKFRNALKIIKGFFHVVDIKGSIEETTVQIIIRDHSRKKFENRKKLAQKIADKINHKYQKQFGEDIVAIEIKDQYYNMREKVEPMMHIVDIAEKAMKKPRHHTSYQTYSWWY